MGIWSASDERLPAMYFRGRVDRLSALIERFQVDATVAYAREQAQGPANFFLYLTPQSTFELIYLARDQIQLNDESKSTGLSDGSELVLAAFIKVTGAGKGVVVSLPDVLRLNLEENPSLKGVVSLLIEEVQHPRCGSGAAFQRLCEVVIIRLLRCVLEKSGTTGGLLAGLSHPRLAYAIVAMHHRLSETWSLDTLASEAGMSRTQFAVVFKEIVGVTPISYLNSWRLEVSRTLLAEGMPVKNVAKECGFASPAAFSRAFSRQYGYSPKGEVRQRAAA
ncbi:MAG: helix-turn-helix transcriptional regulator [Rhodobacteraceae bacterium]|nr:helix-turn-helix transcriptional regulator [Paracoccaceae bacterium]